MKRGRAAHEQIVLPRLGFGCSGLMASLDRFESARVLRSAAEAGISHFDVAPSYGYGEAEGVLGEFLRGRRDAFTVTSKFGIAPPSRRWSTVVRKSGAPAI